MAILCLLVVSVRKAYLGWPGCLAASGIIWAETSRRAVMMLMTASVLMSLVLSNSWLAAVERIAKSLGRAPMVLELEISCTNKARAIDIVSFETQHLKLATLMSSCMRLMASDDAADVF